MAPARHTRIRCKAETESLYHFLAQGPPNLFQHINMSRAHDGRPHSHTSTKAPKTCRNHSETMDLGGNANIMMLRSHSANKLPARTLHATLRPFTPAKEMCEGTARQLAHTRQTSEAGHTGNSSIRQHHLNCPRAPFGQLRAAGSRKRVCPDQGNPKPRWPTPPSRQRALAAPTCGTAVLPSLCVSYKGPSHHHGRHVPAGTSRTRGGNRPHAASPP